VSYEATCELAAALGVSPLALLQANPERPRCKAGLGIGFAALRPGDVLLRPGGGEVEIVRMGAPPGNTFGQSSIVGDYQAELNTRIQNLKGQAAATFQSVTGADVTNARVAQGASATMDLLQNGIDTSSVADEQKLVAAIAGGLALIVPIGTMLGAALEVLNQVYLAAGCPTLKLAADLGLGALPPECGGAECTQTGPSATLSSVLAANAGALPAQPSGSFAALACAALAKAAADAANCKTSLPPGVIVDGVVNAWNAVHAGPAEPYLVPPLAMVNQGIAAWGPTTILVTWQNVSSTGSSPSRQAGKDPYAYWAFQPLSSIPASESPNLSATPAGQLWAVAPSPIFTVDPPRFVMVNTGALLPSTPQSAPAAAAIVPGMPAAATEYQTGKTYLVTSTVAGADPQTGAQASPSTPVMDEATFLAFMPLAQMATPQILWWGPTGATDDPAGYLQAGWLGQLFALGESLHAIGGQVWLLAVYEGSGQPVPQGVYAYDVTGSMVPRATSLAPAGLSTGAKVGIGVGVTAAAAGGLWIALGRPVTIAAAQAALRALVGL
jgi:hypothetical protein